MHVSNAKRVHQRRDREACLEVDTLLALEDANEFTGDDSALVDQLVKGMLAICARLSKVYLTRLKGQPCAINGNTLAIALHRHLNIACILGRLHSKGQVLGSNRDGKMALRRNSCSASMHKAIEIQIS